LPAKSAGYLGLKSRPRKKKTQMAELTVHYTSPIGAQARSIVSPLEEARVNLYREKWAELSETGWKPATIINLAPWQIYCSGVLAPIRELRISNVPREQEAWDRAPKLRLNSGAEVPFVKHVFEYPDVTILEQVHGFEGSFAGSTGVRTTMPIQFAQDVFQQNNTPTQRGGLFYYLGTHDPLKHGDKELHAKEMQQVETSFAQLVTYCNQMLEEGNAAHAENNIHKIREIQKYHRWAVRYLRLLGILGEDPKWITKAVKVGAPITQHCVCGKEAPAEAVVCKDCNRILNPVQAFEQFVIDLQSPGVRLVLKRMDAKELQGLIEKQIFTLAEVREVLEDGRELKPPKEVKEPKEPKAPKAKE
jgi:hypothetical protein